MIYSLFNIVVIYFYETSLLLFILNYRYILGSISYSSATPRRRDFFSVSQWSLIFYQSNMQHLKDSVLDKDTLKPELWVPVTVRCPHFNLFKSSWFLQQGKTPHICINRFGCHLESNFPTFIKRITTSRIVIMVLYICKSEL